MKRRTLLVAMTVAVGLIGAAPASAHEALTAAGSNSIDLDRWSSRRRSCGQGDTMTFKVGVQNNNALFGTPCDVTGARHRLPPADRERPVRPAAPINVALNQAVPIPGRSEAARAGLHVGRRTSPTRATSRSRAGAVRGTLHVTAADRTRLHRQGHQLHRHQPEDVDRQDRLDPDRAGAAERHVHVSRPQRQRTACRWTASRSAMTCARARPTRRRQRGQPAVERRDVDLHLHDAPQAPGIYTNTANACATARCSTARRRSAHRPTSGRSR